MQGVYVLILLLPLLSGMVVGLLGRQIGCVWAHRLTTASVALAFLLSLWAFKHITLGGMEVYHADLYTWAVVSHVHISIGLLIDNLTILMMLVVTFVSLMVHIYTIGYMQGDPGYQRFFSYISLFTFAMLTLVMSNNFVQLFFAWEAVGLISYLLIGFWFKKSSAVHANMKAFIVNRVGDFAFILGIAVLFRYSDSFNYLSVFTTLGVGKVGDELPVALGTFWEDSIGAMDLTLILLFIGAMAKSAQAPLHVWLPDSMEGPTPISALIHAATMVTAGIFMVARMSPLYEFSDIALNFILIVGATTAFFIGLVGIVQNDIKRVVAYSTISQLGYMTAALGASAYSVAIFHLMTHAFFKALLFLAAGSVIMAMHHEQDMRKMGGLRRYMPITYATALIGSLALIGFPGLAGFFSKDLVIMSVLHSEQPGAVYAYYLLLAGVFVTAFYTFRLFFMVFHGDERMDNETLSHLKESPSVVSLPLILLAIPSVLAGYMVTPLIFGDFFKQSLSFEVVSNGGVNEVLKATTLMSSEAHSALSQLQANFHGIFDFIIHGLLSVPFWLAIAGVLLAWLIYVKEVNWAEKLQERLARPRHLLEKKYYLDDFNQKVLANTALYIGHSVWTLLEKVLVDGVFVNGVGKLVRWMSSYFRQLQTGYLYHYAFSMVIGLAVLLVWVLYTTSSRW